MNQQEVKAMQLEYDTKMRELLTENEFPVDKYQSQFEFMKANIASLMANKSIAEFAGTDRYKRFCSLDVPVKMFEMEIAISLLQKSSPNDVKWAGTASEWADAIETNIIPVVDAYNDIHKELETPVKRSIEARAKIMQGVPDTKKIFK